jgi:hypothetical protein
MAMGDESLEGDLESIQEGNSHHLGMRIESSAIYIKGRAQESRAVSLFTQD